MTFLSLLFFQISHILSSWKDVYLSIFGIIFLVFTASLLVGILPVLSQVWDLSVYFSFFKKNCFNESSEVELWQNGTLCLISRVLADRYLSEIDIPI